MVIFNFFFLSCCWIWPDIKKQTTSCLKKNRNITLHITKVECKMLSYSFLQVLDIWFQLLKDVQSWNALCPASKFLHRFIICLFPSCSRSQRRKRRRRKRLRERRVKMTKKKKKKRMEKRKRRRRKKRASQRSRARAFRIWTFGPNSSRSLSPSSRKTRTHIHPSLTSQCWVLFSVIYL